MQIFLAAVLVFVTFVTNAHACDTPAFLIYKNQKIKVCQTGIHYLSPNCKSVGECFFQKTIELKFYPNQSPGFSLCYQLGGKAFFGSIAGVKIKVPMCHKNGIYSDQEALLLHYRDHVFKPASP